MLNGDTMQAQENGTSTSKSDHDESRSESIDPTSSYAPQCLPIRANADGNRNCEPTQEKKETEFSSATRKTA